MTQLTTQLQCDIPTETAARLQKKAEEMNLSVSKYITQLLQKDLRTDEELAKDNGWPEGFFDLYGSTQDAPLERPHQGEHQAREPLL
ncbi:MAG: hypothetical protein AAFV90_09245 [Cyanobacteria bacterium J06634_5]